MGKRGRWQVGGNTSTSARGGIGRLDRRRAMLLCSVACCTIIAFSSPAAAQVTGFGTDVALPTNTALSGMGISNLVTGAPTTLNNLTLDGQSGQGFFVTS